MGVIYKLRRSRREKAALRLRGRLKKVAVIAAIAVVIWQGWVHIGAIWPSWNPKPEPDPYKDCVLIDGPTEKNIAEICPDK